MSRIKAWVVDVFTEVDRRPLWQVVIAKLVHCAWRGFREA